MIHLDHVQLLSYTPLESATLLARILGTAPPTPEGRDDDMFRISLDHESFILFAEAKAVPFTHFAVKVDSKRFGEIVQRLRSEGVTFGNDHEDATNGKTQDPLGGEGRVYWLQEDGHLLEVTC